MFQGLSKITLSEFSIYCQVWKGIPFIWLSAFLQDNKIVKGAISFAYVNDTKTDLLKQRRILLHLQIITDHKK